MVLMSSSKFFVYVLVLICCDIGMDWLRELAVFLEGGCLEEAVLMACGAFLSPVDLD